MCYRVFRVAILCLVVATAPTVVRAQYGGSVHNGGWANGTGVLLPPHRTAEPVVPVALVLSGQTSFTAGGTSAFADLYLNAPMSEARGRIRIIRISDSTIVGTSGWTSASFNRVVISGLVVGTSYRVEVDLQALAPAWLSVPWFTMIAAYVQPGKYDPPYDFYEDP